MSSIRRIIHQQDARYKESLHQDVWRAVAEMDAAKDSTMIQLVVAGVEADLLLVVAGVDEATRLFSEGGIPAAGA